MVRVGIISASGYAGGELVRYLLGHPGVQITYLSSGTFAGRPLSEAYPSLAGQDLPSGTAVVASPASRLRSNSPFVDVGTPRHAGRNRPGRGTCDERDGRSGVCT